MGYVVAGTVVDLPDGGGFAFIVVAEAVCTVPRLTVQNN